MLETESWWIGGKRKGKKKKEHRKRGRHFFPRYRVRCECRQLKFWEAFSLGKEGGLGKRKKKRTQNKNYSCNGSVLNWGTIRMAKGKKKKKCESKTFGGGRSRKEKDFGGSSFLRRSEFMKSFPHVRIRTEKKLSRRRGFLRRGKGGKLGRGGGVSWGEISNGLEGRKQTLTL